jgi:hypothetical protein
MAAYRIARSAVSRRRSFTERDGTVRRQGAECAATHRSRNTPVDHRNSIIVDRDDHQRSARWRLLGFALPRFDLDHLAPVIHAATGADMMRPLEVAAMTAVNEVQGYDEMMATAIALPVPADPLFWKRAHP